MPNTFKIKFFDLAREAGEDQLRCSFDSRTGKRGGVIETEKDSGGGIGRWLSPRCGILISGLILRILRKNGLRS